MKKLASFFAICAAAFFAGTSLYAADPATASTASTATSATTSATTAASAIDENDLFGGDSSGIDAAATGGTSAGNGPASATGTNGAAKASAVSSFLKTDAVRIGGSYSGSLSPSWTWTNPWNGSFKLNTPDSAKLTPDVGAKVFFDARPDEDTRFYGSMKASWPFENKSTFLTGATYVPAISAGPYSIPASVSTTTGTISAPNLKVFELFADRSWNDTLFFRFGKHTVKWGVGYFWSPADVINVSSIDVTDPSAQLEGPISLRLQIPFAGTQNNIWAYAVVPAGIDAAELKPYDIGYAAKYEFLLGNYEIGMGGFWQRNVAPKALLSATGAVWKFNLFGEAVASWGSDKQWVDSITLPLSATSVKTSKDDDGVYFSGTAGFQYSDTTNNYSVTAQYFYNGNGYSYSRRKDLINDARSMLSRLSGTSAEAAMTGVFKGLMYQSGEHYAGLYLGKTKFLSDDLTLGLLTIANLSDISGFTQPSASYTFFKGFSGSLNPTFYWAAPVLWGANSDAEYVVMTDGPSMTLSFKASLGGGSF